MIVAEATVLEAVLRRDRIVVVAALVGVIVVAWIWIVLGAGTGMSAVAMTQMAGTPDMDMMMERAVWTAAYAGLIFAMWWAMMVAMMLPGAAPMVLLFARVNRSRKVQDRPYVPTGIFAAGYMVAWGGFSALAAGLQWGLEQLDFLSAMMTTTSYWLGGAILLAAGAWQLTPIKGVCLRHCRSPLSFLVHKWRPGSVGAFRMGLEHGAYCLGCCWFLMGLLFFGGIMNLFWIAGLAAFILLEKTIPMGHWIGRVAGIGIAAYYFLRNRRAAVRLAAQFAGIRTLLTQKYYVDEIYDATIVQPIRILSEDGLWHGIDVRLIDGTVNGVARTVGSSSQILRRIQTGSVRAYAASLFFGVVLILGYYLWR